MKPPTPGGPLPCLDYETYVALKAAGLYLELAQEKPRAS